MLYIPNILCGMIPLSKNLLVKTANTAKYNKVNNTNVIKLQIFSPLSAIIQKPETNCTDYGGQAFMTYLITFLEGMITFISPCLLPMLPVYAAYFAGGTSGEQSGRRSPLFKAAAFVLGFTITFAALGAFAGSIGMLLKQYQTGVNIVSGLVVIFFGLNFLGVIRLSIFRGTTGMGQNTEMGILSTVLFGIVFAVGWTPCVGAFLGSALMLASSAGSVFHGMILLLCYSAGLGIPFLISAVLIQKLKTTFDWIKQHYSVINKVSGGLLILVGILMMTGWLNEYLSLLA